MKEETVEFINKSGTTLRGIVHMPDSNGCDDKEKKGVNIVVAGIKYRVAPNRLSIKIARHLCSKGWFVFRWDPSGIGESDGYFDDNRIEKEIFIEIQKGKFISDAKDANDFFKDKYGLEEIVVLGNCGGAATAVLSHDLLESKRLVLIDLPPTFSLTERAFDKEALRGGGYSERILRGYFSKVFSWKSWLRFFSLKSSYKVIFGLLKNRTKSFLPNKNNASADTKMAVPSFTSTGEEINRNLFAKFSSFLEKGGKVLLVCAQNDKSTPVTEQYFLPSFDAAGTSEDAPIMTRFIENANHIYTAIESQFQLIAEIDKWLSKSDFRETN